MSKLLSELPKLEQEAREINQALYIYQNTLIEVAMQVTLYRLEYDGFLDIELFEAHLVIFFDYIRELEADIAINTELFKAFIDKIIDYN
jgi:hypothetical protein